MFKRILVAVDGSPASDVGLKSAAALATDQHATLFALHVVDDPPVAVTFDGSYLPTNYVDSFYEALRENGRNILARAAAFAQSSSVGFKPVLVEARGRMVADAIVQPTLSYSARTGGADCGAS